jgi:tetratricopeptide (TPR) repeat protein
VSAGTDETLPASTAPGGADTAPATVSGQAVQLPVVEPAHYEMREQLGRGGMGKVVVARDRRLGRLLAVKVSQSDEQSMQVRFTREAVLTARLQHPSIIPVHEAGVLAGEPFYAMKLVAGKSLAQLIAKTTELDERLALLPNVIAVVDALAYAHAQRVIHRDLKPDNVIVGEYGETIVIDWGLAKELDADEAPSATPYREASAAQTVEGAAMGTPPYMAPEQAAGERVDERADVYGLGAMLYHVLAGAPPYKGANAYEVMEKVLKAPPQPLAERAVGIPKDLLAIVDKAMAREPADRYANAKQLAEDLKRFERGQLVAAHAYSRRELVRRWLARHRAAVAVAAMALVAVGVAVTLLVRAEIRERVAREQRSADFAATANAQLAAGEFARAAETLQQQVTALDVNRAQAERVRRIAEFYKHARAASFLFGDEDRGVEATAELVAGLRALDALDDEGNFVAGWTSKLALDDLTAPQRHALHEELYRHVLFLAFLHFKHGGLAIKPALIIPKTPEAAKHFGAMFDTLAQTSELERVLGVKPARVARVWQTMALDFYKIVATDAEIAAAGNGPLTDAAPGSRENAVDYWLLGAGHYAVYKAKDTPLGKLLALKFPGLLDYETPLVTAERQLRTAIRIDPRLYWPHFMLGWALRDAGDPGGAEIAFDVCVQLEPANIFGFAQRAHALAERAMKEPAGVYRDELIARALEDSATVVAKAPQHPVAYWSRGDLMRYLQRADEAVAAYTRALELDPDLSKKFSRVVALPEIRAYIATLPASPPTTALLAAIDAQLAKLN